MNKIEKLCPTTIQARVVVRKVNELVDLINMLLNRDVYYLDPISKMEKSEKLVENATPKESLVVHGIGDSLPIDRYKRAKGIIKMNKCVNCNFETRRNPIVCPMCGKKFNEKDSVKTF
jgi:rubrerythrin